MDDVFIGLPDMCPSRTVTLLRGDKWTLKCKKAEVCIRARKADSWYLYLIWVNWLNSVSAHDKMNCHWIRLIKILAKLCLIISGRVVIFVISQPKLEWTQIFAHYFWWNNYDITKITCNYNIIIAVLLSSPLLFSEYYHNVIIVIDYRRKM